MTCSGPQKRPARLAARGAFCVLTQKASEGAYTASVYNLRMHVIAKPMLVEFWMKHPDAQAPLEAWYRIMDSETFTDFNDLRGTFASADYVDGLTVFNIGGNKYRLIAAIHYNRCKVYVRAVLTHERYDRDGWKRRP